MKQIKICPNTILLIILMILIVGVVIKYKYEFFNIKLEKKSKKIMPIIEILLMVQIINYQDMINLYVNFHIK